MTISRCLAGALAVCGATASLAAAQAGVRGTVSVAWSNTTGAPITAWDGHANLLFRPMAANRADILRAIRTPTLGEAYRAVRPTQVHSADVTSLSSSKTETVSCPVGGHGDHWVDRTMTTTSGGIADARVAFEYIRPEVDLLTGRGSLMLSPYIQANSGRGNTGWWIEDRWVLPGRWNTIGTYPCEGDSQPALRLPRVFAKHGGAAVPRPVSDWLESTGRRDWVLRRDAKGRWRVIIAKRERTTFSESVFGPQNTQQMNYEVRSSLYLAGSLRALRARCVVPRTRIARAKSPAAAVNLARRAGLPNVRFAGTVRIPRGWRGGYEILSPHIDSMSRAPCGAGSYRVRKLVPQR